MTLNIMNFFSFFFKKKPRHILAKKKRKEKWGKDGRNCTANECQVCYCKITTKSGPIACLLGQMVYKYFKFES